MSSKQGPSRYIATLIFPVPDSEVQRFLAIHRKTSVLYRQLGAENVEIYRLSDGTSKYGCIGLETIIPTHKDEQLIMVVDSYLSKDEFLHVSALADENSAIAGLFEELAAIVDIKRVTRAEYELAQS